MADAVARTGGSGTPSAPEPGWGTRVVTFYHGVVAEMKKVTWPDRGQVRQATIQIIVFVLLIGAMISVLDLVLQGLLIKGIPSLFAGR
jgi:preprotein translocase subunit SecE